MTGFMRKFLVHRLAPEDLAVKTIDGEHHEFMVLGLAQVVVASRSVRKARLQGLAVRYRGGQEDMLTPYDRRGLPLAWHGDLPVWEVAPQDRGDAK